MKRVLIVLPLLILLSTPDSSANQPRTKFHRIDKSQAPLIDGNLEDAVWATVESISDLHQTRPDDRGIPSERTEVQIARSTETIYVAFKVFDSDVSNLSAKGLIQGQNFFSDDRVGIQLDSFNDSRNSYFFQVNANGIRRDALVGNDYFIDDWSTIWYAATEHHDWGWTAEFAIPIKSIAFDPNSSEWGLNIGRVHPRNGEEMSWASRDRSTSPAAFGKVSEVDGFDQGLGLEFAPSVSLVYTDDSETGSSTQLEPSVTSFYNLTPFLTAGLTLNTDFSATDVDDRQVNLSRFSLFFPEKREFFLRDASIFEFGNIGRNGRPFFSRRIGLSSEGDPLSIDAGAKLSGRINDWNVGALAIRQDAEFEGADNDLFVGRLTRNVFNESEVGLIATSGDPTSNNGNSLLGVDYTYRNSRVFGDQRLRANLWYQQTETDGFNDDQSAYGIGLDYPNFKYSGFINYKRIEENFNPALGFVNRLGVEQVDAQARYRHKLDDSYWQWLRTRVQYFKSDRIDGDLQSQSIFWNVLEGFSGQNDFFTFFVGQTKEGIIEPFELRDDIEIPIGEYTSNRYGVFFETGPQKPLSIELEIADGDFFGGSRLQISPELNWRPNKHVLASFSATENRISLPQGDFTSRLYSARFNYAFDKRWAWLNVVQADNFSDTISINSRLRFQQRADREFFLVFNQTRDRNTDEILDSAIVFKAAINLRI